LEEWCWDSSGKGNEIVKEWERLSWAFGKEKLKILGLCLGRRKNNSSLSLLCVTVIGPIRQEYEGLRLNERPPKAYAQYSFK
jgi:hypothetical protein